MRSIPWKQMLISLGVAAMTVWRVPLADLRAAFRHLETGGLLLALFSFLVWLFLRAYKWHLLMASAGKARVRQSLRALFGGFALGLITPGRLGELGRCLFVRHQERAQVALLTVFDRLLDFWAILTSIAAGLFLWTSRPAAVFGVAIWLALLPVVMGFPTLVSHLGNLARKSKYLRGHFSEAVGRMPLVPTTRLAMLALGAMGTELAMFFFLLSAFHPAEFATTFVTYPFIVLAGDLPVSFGGVGVREGAAALLLLPYAVPSGAAVSAALVWFAFAVLLPAALGTVWLVVERVRSSRHRLDRAAPPADPTWAQALSPPATDSAWPPVAPSPPVDPAWTLAPPPASTPLSPKNATPRCQA